MIDGIVCTIIEENATSYQPRQNLPDSLQQGSREDLIAEMPFAWRPSVSSEIFDTVVHEDLSDGQPEDDFFEFYRGGKFVMPGKVSEYIVGLLTSSPEIMQVVFVQESDSDDAVIAFERDCLGYDQVDMTSSKRPFDTASGFTAPGRYPLEVVAKAMRADEDRLRDFFDEPDQEAGTYAKIGEFLVQAAHPDGITVADLAIGDIARLTNAGNSLVTQGLIAIDLLTQEIDVIHSTHM